MQARLKEQNGQVIIEAEQFQQIIGRNNQQWLTQTVTSGYTGTGYVQAIPDGEKTGPRTA